MMQAYTQPFLKCNSGINLHSVTQQYCTGPEKYRECRNAIPRKTASWHEGGKPLTYWRNQEPGTWSQGKGKDELLS